MRIVKVKFDGTSERRYWYAVPDSLANKRIDIGDIVKVTTDYGPFEVEVVSVSIVPHVPSFMVGAGLTVLKKIDGIKERIDFTQEEQAAYAVLYRWARNRGYERVFSEGIDALAKLPKVRR